MEYYEIKKRLLVIRNTTCSNWNYIHTN